MERKEGGSVGQSYRGSEQKHSFRGLQLEQCTNMKFIMDKRMGGHNLNCVCLDLDFYHEMVNAIATMYEHGL